MTLIILTDTPTLPQIILLNKFFLLLSNKYANTTTITNYSSNQELKNVSSAHAALQLPLSNTFNDLHYIYLKCLLTHSFIQRLCLLPPFLSVSKLRIWVRTYIWKTFKRKMLLLILLLFCSVKQLVLSMTHIYFNLKYIIH